MAFDSFLRAFDTLGAYFNPECPSDGVLDLEALDHTVTGVQITLNAEHPMDTVITAQHDGGTHTYYARLGYGTANGTTLPCYVGFDPQNVTIAFFTLQHALVRRIRVVDATEHHPSTVASRPLLKALQS